MTNPNEMKPAAPAEVSDGGRCAVDALFNSLPLEFRVLDVGERIVEGDQFRAFRDEDHWVRSERAGFRVHWSHAERYRRVVPNKADMPSGPR